MNEESSLSAVQYPPPLPLNPKVTAAALLLHCYLPFSTFCCSLFRCETSLHHVLTNRQWSTWVSIKIKFDRKYQCDQICHEFSHNMHGNLANLPVKWFSYLPMQGLHMYIDPHALSMRHTFAHYLISHRGHYYI